jgi:hypothetical protein
VIFSDSDSDTLVMRMAGVTSVAGGLCYLSYHARTRFDELLGLVWGFVASAGAFPIMNSEFFMVLLAVGCDVAMSDGVCC